MKVPLTIMDHLRRAEQVYPERIAFVDEPDQPATSWGTLTYREMARRARSLAASLDAMGLERGSRIAIVSQNSARLLTAFFGVSGYGRILVPINFRLNAEEIRHIVDHCGAEVLLVDPALEKTLAGINVRRRFVLGAESDEELYLHNITPAPWDSPVEDAVATINYTSGTTARPKGVMLTHRNLWLNAATFGWHIGIDDREVYLHTLPQFHCNGWGMPYAVTAMGGKHIILRKVEGAEILRRVDAHGVTLMCAAPAVVNLVLDAAESWPAEIPGSGRVRIIVAGAPPPARTIELVETQLGWKLTQIYGLTETAPLLTLNQPRPELDGLSPAQRAATLTAAGVPALGVEIAIDEQGEILARSNVVMDGYWNQPEETRQVILDGWFHTGDGGRIADGHVLTISDRKKDVIISGGENISSIEVEDAIFAHAEVAEVAVIGIPDDKWGELVMALVVRKPGSRLTEQEIIAHTKSRLAGYKCPKRIEFRDQLDRTATGKLQKFKLRQPYWRGRDRKIN